MRNHRLLLLLSDELLRLVVVVVVGFAEGVLCLFEKIGVCRFGSDAGHAWLQSNEAYCKHDGWCVFGCVCVCVCVRELFWLGMLDR